MEKKALLVVSFGTSFPETREKTIGAIEEDLKAAFPDRVFYRAFTSGVIRRRMLKEQSVKVDSPAEALERILADGVTDLLIQPTHMMRGKEYEALTETAAEWAGRFGILRYGRPLLYGPEDLDRAADLLPELFPEVGKRDVLLFMGHGSPGGNNSVYVELERLLWEKGYGNFLVALVEGEPDLPAAMEKLKTMEFDRIFLTPLMIVAGDHATNDMAGDEEDSWKNQLIEKGCEVSCILKGMGEYPALRQLYVEHAREAEAL